ncbi:MAG: hypothetical protein AB7T15_04540 [Desulfuromonas sp.]
MINGKIKIDGKEYVAKDLSDEARQNFAFVQLVDKKIAEKQQELAILQTARNAYAAVLRASLPKAE